MVNVLNRALHVLSITEQIPTHVAVHQWKLANIVTKLVFMPLFAYSHASLATMCHESHHPFESLQH